ncbi:hypothetical protein CJ030_MR1G002802 [Morella rubra]|uniref:Uncharacterized protein n=1 Tax=Morella rubra TaxID=262757 RepID=A0A6A1WM31_9ROSI|nr:hypothetical protein CJ030_MR1G002802 [Morella rubra]
MLTNFGIFALVLKGLLWLHIPLKTIRSGTSVFYLCLESSGRVFLVNPHEPILPYGRHLALFPSLNYEERALVDSLNEVSSIDENVLRCKENIEEFLSNAHLRISGKRHSHEAEGSSRRSTSKRRSVSPLVPLDAKEEESEVPLARKSSKHGINSRVCIEVTVLKVRDIPEVRITTSSHVQASLVLKDSFVFLGFGGAFSHFAVLKDESPRTPVVDPSDATNGDLPDTPLVGPSVSDSNSAEHVSLCVIGGCFDAVELSQDEELESAHSKLQKLEGFLGSTWSYGSLRSSWV